jgi:hypothetical protein
MNRAIDQADPGNRRLLKIFLFLCVGQKLISKIGVSELSWLLTQPIRRSAASSTAAAGWAASLGF